MQIPMPYMVADACMSAVFPSFMRVCCHVASHEYPQSSRQMQCSLHDRAVPMVPLCLGQDAQLVPVDPQGTVPA